MISHYLCAIMPLPHHYAMACIFLTGVELDPIKAILEQIRSSLPTQKNSYTLGEVDGHNTIAVLPEIGTDSAVTAARQMKELALGYLTRECG